MGMKRRGFSLMKPRSSSEAKNGRAASFAANKSSSASTSFMEKGGLVSRLSSFSSFDSSAAVDPQDEHSDRYNYALLVALYTLQGIPMGLSASIPFLIQQKVKSMAASAAAAAASSSASTAATAAHAASNSVSKLSYQANAIFALCSWPFSLKLLWAPIVDAVFVKQFGRRKTWLVPVQALAGCIMVMGSGFVEQQLGLGSNTAVPSNSSSFNVQGVTAFFFVLYFLMATQDIAVDGWALTMLSKKNRPKGPVCNSIGQNLGYFLSFVGFLALNDAESSEALWRPLLRLPSQPGKGLVSLGGFIKSMGIFMLVVTTYVAIFKREEGTPPSVLFGNNNTNSDGTSLAEFNKKKKLDDDDDELDAAQLGLKETYHRLWAVCQLPAVRWLFLILLTYRLPTALSDNVKFLKAVEFGLSKSTTALLSPTVVLPLGIAVPLVAAKVWHGHPLRQFMTAYKVRVTLVPLLDVCMLYIIKQQHKTGPLFWILLISSTAMQAIVNSLQFNAQMTFFASRVDPAIGGSYMTLLNTAANLGGTWPSSVVMYLVGKLSSEEKDAYFPMQAVFTILGILWIVLLSHRVQRVAELPDDAWRTHLLDNEGSENGGGGNNSDDVEATPTKKTDLWRRKDSKAE